MSNIIEIRGLNKSYGKTKALIDVSLNVKKGEIVGFVGKNGAGKSTLIRCITNMLFYDSGTIKVFGHNLLENIREIKSRTSYLPSDIILYKNISSLELFKFYSKFGANYEKALELSNYLEFDYKKSFKSLSLGNKNKLLIILSLIRDSELLILDEPTNGLDPIMQNKFFKLILEYKNRGNTVFMSSHNISDIKKYTDRVIIIENSKIIDEIDIKKLHNKKTKICSYKTKDEKVSFEIKEDINDLIARLNKLELIDLQIKDETILKHYEGDGYDS